MEHLGLPGDAVVKNLPANARDAVSIPGVGRSLKGGNSNQLQYSCRESYMDRGTWRAIARGVAESDMTERLGAHTDNRASSLMSSI